MCGGSIPVFVMYSCLLCTDGGGGGGDGNGGNGDGNAGGGDGDGGAGGGGETRGPQEAVIWAFQHANVITTTDNRYLASRISL